MCPAENNEACSTNTQKATLHICTTSFQITATSNKIGYYLLSNVVARILNAIFVNIWPKVAI